MLALSNQIGFVLLQSIKLMAYTVPLILMLPNLVHLLYLKDANHHNYY